MSFVLLNEVTEIENQRDGLMLIVLDLMLLMLMLMLMVHGTVIEIFGHDHHLLLMMAVVVAVASAVDIAVDTLIDGICMTYL